MKKLITCLTVMLCVLLLASCAPIEELYYSIFVNNQRYNNDVELTAELEMTFLNAFLQSALEKEKTFDISQIKILNYYGTIGKAHIVQFNRACPTQSSSARIENMDFRGRNVYIVHKNTLYSIENAYEQKIINFDNLCRLFGINFSGKDTFNKKEYEKLQKQFERDNPDEYDLYYLLGYYGEYNGYSVVTYDYRGMKDNVTCMEPCNGLVFKHGDFSNVFRIMNGEKMLSINMAVEEGILTLENVIDLFEFHTHSAELSESLFNQTLSYIENMCENYPIEEAFTYGYSLHKYYGQYGDVHIFYIDIIFRAENYDMLEWLIGPRVFDGEKFYTLDEALELGLITEEIKSQIR